MRFRGKFMVKVRSGIRSGLRLGQVKPGSWLGVRRGQGQGYLVEAELFRGLIHLSHEEDGRNEPSQTRFASVRGPVKHGPVCKRKKRKKIRMMKNGCIQMSCKNKEGTKKNHALFMLSVLLTFAFSC